MMPQRIQIRRYQSEFKKLLDNLDTNSSELGHWLDRDLHAMVDDPLIPRYPDEYAAIRQRAIAMKLNIYPAFRTQPLSNRANPRFQFSSYTHPDFWQLNADRLTSVAALRLPGNPWIGLDMENYDGGKEPTAKSLGDEGLSVAQLRAAMQPFIDALRATNASVAVYPAGIMQEGEVVLPGEDLLYIAESLGRERIEIWTEGSFDNGEHYRRSARLGWLAAAADFLKVLRQLQSRFPAYIVRPGIKDLDRVWSDPYRLDPLRSGAVAPWGFDETRNDWQQLGTAEYRLGTRLSKLNRVHHVWPLHPLALSARPEFDTAVTEPPTGLSPYEGEMNSLVKRHGDQPFKLNPDGLEFVAPNLPKTWAGLRAIDVLPAHPSNPNLSAAFTVDGTIRLPTCPSIMDSCPIFGAVGYHEQGIWQVVYDGALDKIALYVRGPGNPKVEIRDMMLKPRRGVDIRLQVGRDGNDWLYQAAEYWPVGAVGGDRRAINHDPGVFRSLFIGAGQKVSTFPHSDTMVFSPGIVFSKTWSIYDWLLKPEEVDELREEQWPVPEKRHPGSWPYGYGKPR